MFQYKSSPISNLAIGLLIAVCSFSYINGTMAQETAPQLFNRAYHYLGVDKQKAIELLNQCIAIDSTYSEAYFHRGITYFKLGKYDSALSDFKTTQGYQPERSILWMYRGFTHRNQGNTDLALSCFSNYISQNPQDTSAYAYILKGKMKYELGDFDGAVNDYDMAVKLKPFEEKYQYYKFIALFEAGKYKEALEAVTKLIEINPDFYGYYFYKGNVYKEMESYDSAIFMYNIAIIKNYQNADSYYERASCFVEKDEYNKALEDYNTAIVLKPNDGTFFSARGNCKFEMGLKKSACKDWDEAGSLGYYEDYDKMKQVCEGLNIESSGEGD
ncbi:tetratricopeptide repeat protein [Fulvivirga sp. RKSG066]|nr:tetratricopeptide repeat protein [Fulvivirga aurantia]